MDYEIMGKVVTILQLPVYHGILKNPRDEAVA